MPAPTEQHAQDQCSGVSDARKRIDEYLVSHRVAGVGSFIVSTLDRRDIESVLADADRDRQFVEAVREASEHLTPYERLHGMPWNHLRETTLDIFVAHERIYGTPCTAKETK